MGRRIGRVVRVAALVCLAGAASSCGLLEHSLSPRTYTVNESADAVLNDTILLNIVRASNNEPLNFVAIAKYTGSSQLSASLQASVLYAAEQANPQLTYGPGNAGGNATNSFDLNVLETKDFYTGLLRPMEGVEMEFWFKQGLPRELVFYVLLDAIRFKGEDGVVYEYRNDPTDDAWGDEPASPQCLAAPLQSKAMWYEIHAYDCRFQKFRYLVDLAVRYGLRQEARYKDNPKWTESSKTEPKKIVVPRLCYDAATAWETIKAQGRGVLPVFAICGSGKDSPLSARPFDLTGPRHVSDMVLVSRSPFAIFQYLGRILASNSMDRVLLHPHLRDLNLGDPHVLNIQAGGLGCFAHAWYRGVDYCVPNDGSENTKRIFTLLRALLATNISAADLNATQTVRVTP